MRRLLFTILTLLTVTAVQAQERICVTRESALAAYQTDKPLIIVEQSAFVDRSRDSNYVEKIDPNKTCVDLWIKDGTREERDRAIRLVFGLSDPRCLSSVLRCEVP